MSSPEWWPVEFMSEQDNAGFIAAVELAGFRPEPSDELLRMLCVVYSDLLSHLRGPRTVSRMAGDLLSQRTLQEMMAAQNRIGELNQQRRGSENKQRVRHALAAIHSNLVELQDALQVASMERCEEGTRADDAVYVRTFCLLIGQYLLETTSVTRVAACRFVTTAAKDAGCQTGLWAPGARRKPSENLELWLKDRRGRRYQYPFVRVVPDKLSLLDDHLTKEIDEEACDVLARLFYRHRGRRLD